MNSMTQVAHIEKCKMASIYHQNTHVNITFLIVDDDPSALSLISNASYGEITVMTANNYSEAVTTLRSQFNKVDVVVTNYHMFGPNDVQLKKKIDEEFGNLPVIVISEDMSDQTEQGSLASEATSGMCKDIDLSDLELICKHAIRHRTSGGSKKVLRRIANTIQHGLISKKPKVKWTANLQRRFLRAINYIGFENVVPKKIMKYMNVKGLTRAQVASHLQKYRISMKYEQEEEVMLGAGNMTIEAMNAFINPQPYSFNNNTRRSSNNGFGSQLIGYDLGQSSHMMNSNTGSHGPNPYMNQTSTSVLSQAGPNLLPNIGNLNLGYSNGNLPLNEERRSVFGASQASQVPGVGQYAIPSMNLTYPPSGVESVKGKVPLNDERRNVFGASQLLQVAGFGQYATPNMNPTYPPSGVESVKGKAPLYDERRSVLGTSQVAGFGQYATTSVNSTYAPNGIESVKGKMPFYAEGRNVLGTSQVPQVAGFGQYATTSSSLGMYTNPPSSLGYFGNLLLTQERQSISVPSQVHGFGQYSNGGLGAYSDPCGSLGSVEGQFPLNNERRTTLVPSQLSQVHGFGQYGTSNGGLGAYSNPSGTLGSVGGQFPLNSFELSQASQVHGFGQYGTANGGLSVYSNPSGSLGSVEGQFPLNSFELSQASQVPAYRQHGTTNGTLIMHSNPPPSSLGSVKGKFPSNQETRRPLGPSQVSQVPTSGQYGTASGGLTMDPPPPNKYVGFELYGNGDLVATGGTKVNGNVNGNGNGSLGESSNAMNWNVGSPRGSSETFPTTFSSLLAEDNQLPSHFFAETDGLVPALENLSIGKNDQVINGVFNNALNPQFDQDKSKERMVAEAVQVVNNEAGDIQKNATLEPYPLHDLAHWSFDNGISSDEVSKSLAATTEMYLPTSDIDMMNQEPSVAELPPLDNQGLITYEDFMKYWKLHGM